MAGASPDIMASTVAAPLERRLGTIADVQVFGGTPHAVRIDLDMHALAAKGLTANDISNVLIAANVSSPQGVLSDGHTDTTVVANDAMQTPAEFGALLISSKNGVPVRLSDVASVYSGEQDKYQAAWFGGTRRCAIRSAAPTRPMPSSTIRSSVGAAVEVSLLISIVLVMLVMLVFLRRMRPTLIAMLSVPLSLAGAFVVIEFSVTLTAAVVISALVSLTLTPALCGKFLVQDAPGVVRVKSRTELAVERFDRNLHHRYERALDWAMRHAAGDAGSVFLLLLLTR
ncbi:MAG: hypothetical protein WDW38_006749 [Sanguina aurantia]